MKMKEIAARLGLKDSDIRPIQNEETEIIEKEEQEVKDLKTEVSVKKKHNWKKIFAFAAAGAAIVGTGVAIAVKAKSGSSDAGNVDLWIDQGMGVSYMSHLNFDKAGEMTKMSFDGMSLNEIMDAIKMMNPDIYDVSEQTNWKEAIFIR